jgi:RNA polymerase subunit RPABC4/transcription elongation factor Spt4
MCGGHFSHMLTPFLTTLNQTAVQSTSPIATTQEISCPACSTAVSPEFAWCPQCGAALKAHSCAYCGQIVTPTDKSCSFCGAPQDNS